MPLGDYLGTDGHGFFKDTAWLRIDITTALRGYGLLAQVRGLVCFSAVMSRVYTLYSLKANQAIHVAQPSRVFFKSRVHPCLKINQSSIINNHPNQSLWLLICVNLCQSVVYIPLASAVPKALG